jgi:hypothetical protein
MYMVAGRYILCFFALIAVTVSATAANLDTDGCRFIDRNTGQPVFLIGAANIDLGFNYQGIPGVFVTGFDPDSSDPPPVNGSFDLEGAFASMKEYGCNLACVYVSEHVWGPPTGNEHDPGFGIDMPWSTCATGGGYQMQSFNPIFWDKLARVIQAADSQDITLQIIIFNKSSFWWFDSNPWNPVLNVNDGDPDCEGLEFHGTEGLETKDDFFCLRTGMPIEDLVFMNDASDLNMLQRIIVDQLIDTAIHPGCGAVIELVNEFETVTSEGFAWLESFHNYLGSRSPVPVIYNPFGFNQANMTLANLPSIQAIALHLDHDPDLIHRQIIRARRMTGKPVLLNEPLRWRTVDNARKAAWACLLAGGTYLGWKDILTPDDWTRLHAYLEPISELVTGRTNRFPEVKAHLDYWSMRPYQTDEDIVVSEPDEITRCYAMNTLEHTETLIYLEGSVPLSSTLILSVPPGFYHLFWLDPADLTSTNPVQSRFEYTWVDNYLLPSTCDGHAVFFLPESFSGERVVYLKRSGAYEKGMRVNLWINDTLFRPYDRCRTGLTLINEGAPFTSPVVDVMVVLEIMNSFYFAPDWTTMPQRLNLSLSSKSETIELFDFQWPAVAEPLNSIRFHAGLLLPGTDILVDSISTVEFSYEP